MERELDKNKALWSLFEAITRLRDAGECARFFRDLCTFPELNALAERWEVAQLVAQGIPYRRIRDRTGASTATWIVACLNQAKRDDDIIVTEAPFPVGLLDLPQPGTYFGTSTAGGLGWGLGAALGLGLWLLLLALHPILFGADPLAGLLAQFG